MVDVVTTCNKTCDDIYATNRDYFFVTNQFLHLSRSLTLMCLTEVKHNFDLIFNFFFNPYYYFNKYLSTIKYNVIFYIILKNTDINHL